MAIISTEQISRSRMTGSTRMNICSVFFINAPKSSFNKAAEVSAAPAVGETSLTSVFSFVPGADPTPSLKHHSRLGQQISHTDEGAEFPTKKKKEKAHSSVCQDLGKRGMKTVKMILNYFYIENHNAQREHNRL